MQEPKKTSRKGFTDQNGVIAESTDQAMSYWSQQDPTVAPRTEGQLLELIMVEYVKYLHEKAPKKFEPRNMFGNV